MRMELKFFCLLLIYCPYGIYMQGQQGGKIN
jgi:hypothetical protein